MNQLMKRVLSVLLVVCLLCSALPSAFAAEGGGFTDVSKDHWAYDAITEAVAAGYFKGVSDTAFDPEGTLTRAMLVTVLARAAAAMADGDVTVAVATSVLLQDFRQAGFGLGVLVNAVEAGNSHVTAGRGGRLKGFDRHFLHSFLSYTIPSKNSMVLESWVSWT